MFSYRHAFHAGNHADVLKHTALLCILQHLTAKETPLSVVDTHAGAGLYRLDGDFAQTSNESEEGVLRLFASQPAPRAAAIQTYMAALRHYNPGMADGGKLRIYPGSPVLAQHLLRAQDKLHLFELQPADMRALRGNTEQLQAHSRQVQVYHEDGFAGALRLLPPPSRRGLLLCDPSYELKSDYAQVHAFITAALKKFATGVYVVWYPIIPRPEAHELPRKLKALARQAGKSWLNASVTVKSSAKSGIQLPGEKVKRPGMAASGIFIINPPYPLKGALQSALPELSRALGQDHLAGFKLENGEASVARP